MEARGFTLLELIVVLGFVAVLSSTAVWSALRWAPDFRLNAAARQVVLDLRTARMRAMSEHVSRRLLFTPATDSYRPQQRADDTYEDDGAEVILPVQVDLTDCSARGDAIGFSARGTASTFGTVVLRASTGTERQIIVDIVGRVRVE